MKIEQIQQIIEVAQVGSINRASQNLYIAQSTLSSSIKCVETELRQKLFIRTQKGIEQTEFGKIFVKPINTFSLPQIYNTETDLILPLKFLSTICFLPIDFSIRCLISILTRILTFTI